MALQSWELGADLNRRRKDPTLAPTAVAELTGLVGIAGG